MKKFKVLITGGAGFIGSHLVDSLMEAGCKVRVLDNLSAGNLENLKQWDGNPDFSFLNIDLVKPLDSIGGERFDFVYHLAANPEVRVSSTNPETHFNQNVIATLTFLSTYVRVTALRTWFSLQHPLSMGNQQ